MEKAVVSTYGIDYEPEKGWELNQSAFANDVLSEGMHIGEIVRHRHNEKKSTCTLHVRVYPLKDGEPEGEGIMVMMCATWIPRIADGQRPEIFNFDWDGYRISDVRAAA